MAAPTITTLSPVFGSKTGGTSVVITGTGFTSPSVTSVTFDGLAAVSFSVDSATQITALSPALGTAAAVPLTVTNADGSAIFEFYYLNSDFVPSATYTAVNPYFDPAANYTFFSPPEFIEVENTPGAEFVLTYDPNTGTIGYDTAGGGSGAGWLLTGNSPAGPGIFGTLNSENISFQADSTEYMSFDVATGRLTIDADNFQVTSSTLVNIATAIISITGTSGIGIGTSSLTPIIVIGNSANELDIDSTVIKMNSLPAATTSDVVYYNSSTKALSFGAVPGGGVDWVVGGNTFGDGLQKVFGSLTNNQISFQVNSLEFMNLEDSGTKNMTIDVDNFTLTGAGGGTVSISGASPVVIDSSSGVSIGTALTSAVTVGQGTAPVTLVGPQVNVTALANATTANTVFYNTGTGRLTYGVAAASSGFTQVNVQIFEVAGANTYTPTPGMKYCQVIATGAGGSGGGAAVNNAAAGGGAGGTVFGLFDAATIGASQAIVVGTGGAPLSNSAGVAGTNTTFGTLMTAIAGSGGANITNGAGGDGGIGGAGSGYQSLAGQRGSYSFETGGAALAPGGGGASYWGTNCEVVRSESVDQTGTIALLAGNGGGGSVSFGGLPIGGAGANGIVVITEYI